MNRKYIWLHVLALVAYFILSVLLLCAVFGYSFPAGDLLQAFSEGALWSALVACMVLVIRAAFRKIKYLLALWKDARAAKRNKVQYK